MSSELLSKYLELCPSSLSLYEVHPTLHVVESYVSYRDALSQLVSTIDSESIMGAEIGVWGGDNTYQLLESHPNLSMFAIDPWCQFDKFDGPSQYELWESKYNQVIDRMKVFGDRCKIIRQCSVDAVVDVEFDFVFIDGDHRYAFVLDDLEKWYPLIKDTGFLCGHDWYIGGVRRAVKDFARKHNIQDILLFHNPYVDRSDYCGVWAFVKE